MADGRNVTVFGDVSDKFDALVAYDEKLLDNWVAEEGYSTGSMVLASTAMAFMTFAKGFVDLGRIGNGILVEGGIKGVGKDVLRALNFAGGAGAIISRGAKLLRLVQTGNLCVWYAHANALRLTGQRFFVTVEQLAKAAGVNVAQLVKHGTNVAQIHQLRAALQAMGIPVQQLSNGIGHIANVLHVIRMNAGSVVIFAIGKPGSSMGHVLYGTWSRLGGFAIRDPLSRFQVFRSVEDIAARYGQNVFAAGNYPMLLVPQSLLMSVAEGAQTVGGGSLLSSLLVQLMPVITMSASDGETAVQTLTVHEQVAAAEAQPKPSPKAKPGGGRLTGKQHTVVAGDWLSKLAKQYYGDMHKWPVIFAGNTRTIGRNPNLIRPGQKLLIPDLPGTRIVSASAISGGLRAVA